MINSNLSNRCRVFGPCIFYALRKIKAKRPEVILVLASNQRKPYEVLIIQGKPPSPNLEKVVFFVVSLKHCCFLQKQLNIIICPIISTIQIHNNALPWHYCQFSIFAMNSNMISSIETSLF